MLIVNLHKIISFPHFVIINLKFEIMNKFLIEFVKRCLDADYNARARRKEQIEMMYWYSKCMKQYADFSGRARRKEFWLFFLSNVCISIICATIDGLLKQWNLLLDSGILISEIYYLFIIIPSLAVGVRRLHDIGKSGWNLLLTFIPFVGTILWLVWACTDGERNGNAWGPDPKESDSESVEGLS